MSGREIKIVEQNYARHLEICSARGPNTHPVRCYPLEKESFLPALSPSLPHF